MAEDFVIGRDPGCDLVLDERTVSGRHATVELDGDRLVLRDCSRNGSFVKNRAGGLDKVSRHVLAAGQVLCFGAAEVSAETLVQHLSQHFNRPLSLVGNQGAAGAGAQFHAVIRRPQPRPSSPQAARPEPLPHPEPETTPEPESTPAPELTPMLAAPPAVVLCGGSGAGKTTWLARLLDHLGQAGESGGSVARVRAGLPPAPGAAVPVECGVVVGLSDVSLALRLRDTPAATDAAGDMAALLCFASADPAARAAHRSAVAAARARFAGPAVLVLSHCDRLLPSGHPAWAAEAGWWRALPDGEWWDDLARDFNGAVFPVGSIGQVAGTLAACPDEFGNTVFLSAAPLGIEPPLRHLANHLRQVPA